MRTDYYVYLHRKVTTGEVFYVGKGNGRRLFKTSSRSSYWRNIYKKHGVVVEIVESGLQEWYAFELEQLLIAYYGRSDIGYGSLCNLSDGGEGNSGVLRSDEFKNNLSKQMKGKQPHPNAAKARGKSVIRDDGLMFPSAAAAARHMRTEGYPLATHFIILAVANKRPHCITAYGYSWKFLKDKND